MTRGLYKGEEHPLDRMLRFEKVFRLHAIRHESGRLCVRYHQYQLP